MKHKWGETTQETLAVRMLKEAGAHGVDPLEFAKVGIVSHTRVIWNLRHLLGLNVQCYRLLEDGRQVFYVLERGTWIDPVKKKRK